MLSENKISCKDTTNDSADSDIKIPMVYGGRIIYCFHTIYKKILCADTLSVNKILCTDTVSVNKHFHKIISKVLPQKLPKLNASQILFVPILDYSSRCFIHVIGYRILYFQFFCLSV